VPAGAATVVNARGVTIHVDPGDPRGARLVESGGAFIPGSLRLWQHLLDLHPWETVLDVGANYGEMLVGAELPPGAELVAFEPNPAVRSHLARTLAGTDLSVDLRAQAVAAEPGTARFAVDREWSGTSSLAAHAAEDERYAVLEVAVTTVDEVLGERPRAWCAKVDVEGFEEDVLAGAARSLGWPTPWALMLEIEHMPRALLVSLARQHAVSVLDTRSDTLVRLEPDHVDVVLAQDWVMPQDCVVTQRT
jgi:FkbM family methyltransferase